MMDIKQKIREMAASTAQNSITPESLGRILMAMYEATEDCGRKQQQAADEMREAMEKVMANFRVTSVTDCSTNSGLANAYVRLADKSAQYVTAQGWVSYEMACRQGEVFAVSGQGGNAPRLWGFLDIDRRVLMMAEAGGEVYREITAPEGTALLVCNVCIDPSHPNFISPFLGKVKRQRVNALWKGPFEVFQKMAMAGVKDSETAYIIKE